MSLTCNSSLKKKKKKKKVDGDKCIMGESTLILQREVILQAVEFSVEVNRCKNDSMPVDIVDLHVKNTF